MGGDRLSPLIFSFIVLTETFSNWEKSITHWKYWFVEHFFDYLPKIDWNEQILNVYKQSRKAP